MTGRPALPTFVRSGGQTGVVLAAFDAAMACGLPCGGWVPAGRHNERGRIPDTYPGLKETPSTDVAQRTEWNVRDADATLILTRGPLRGGTTLTSDMASAYGRPLCILDLAVTPPGMAATRAAFWFAGLRGAGSLNVAGPRESDDAAIGSLATDVLRRWWGGG